MRDALADIMQSETRYAPVTDGEGRIAGVLSVEIIQDFLTSPEAAVEEHAAAERPLTVEHSAAEHAAVAEREAGAAKGPAADYPPGD